MIGRVAAGIGAALMAVLVPVPAVHAQDTYRYWSYWVAEGSWTYSARGPGFRVPPDGGVEGWRFVVSPKDGSQAVSPGGPNTYAELCPNQPPPPAGKKRVAVVIDPGPPGIAPVGDATPARTVKCIQAGVNDTGLQVLQAVTTLRFHSSGLICGIGGFPSTECPGQSTTAVAATQPAATTAASPTPATGTLTAPPSAASLPSRAPSDAPTPTATPTTAVARSSPETIPSPVALALGDDPAPPAGSNPPGWIAAIGAAMIAGLLALAYIARRGRS